MSDIRIAVAGATGAVGIELLNLIEERGFRFSSLRLLASARSAGVTVDFMGATVKIEDLSLTDPSDVDIAFFSAGAERSRAFAPAFAEAGAWVIDNSSAFRRDRQSALIVPEINGRLLAERENRLIANPNCSTIIALLPLTALHREFGLERVLVTTFQAVSGAGGAALDELTAQTRAVAAGRKPEAQVFARPIIHNLIPSIGAIDKTGFCVEEEKMAFESRKILDCADLKISSTTVRVPVPRCHSMAIWTRLNKTTHVDAVRATLASAPGVIVAEEAPCPADAAGRDAVYVGRIRPDPDDSRAFWLWAVSDQLRKGAALNAIQIAEELVAAGRIGAR